MAAGGVGALGNWERVGSLGDLGAGWELCTSPEGWEQEEKADGKGSEHISKGSVPDTHLSRKAISHPSLPRALFAGNDCA